MSYDLMVFDPASAPAADRGAFMDWFRTQTSWSEEHGYNNPTVAAPNLQTWFFNIIKEFPPINGSYRSEDYDNPKLTDYSVGRSIIYAAFGWSQAQDAYATVFKLAQKHRVGFFDVSADDGEVWLPSADGGYQCVHGTSQPGTPRYYVATAIKKD